MQKDPYLILGLSKGASKEEIDARYAELRDKYSNDRFVEGEVGMEAARKISELEQAYKDCIEDLRNAETENNFGSLYGSIENAIKSANYDDAQRQLDDIDIRDAEWHYYQSMVYFKKGWHSESKAQLEICIALEPHNDKYNKALNKMNDYLKNSSPFNNNQQPNANQQSGQYQQNQQNQQQRAGYSDRQTNAENNANACCDSCCTLMCCDSCCECMGGDLIPCC